MTSSLRGFKAFLSEDDPTPGAKRAMLEVQHALAERGYEFQRVVTKHRFLEAIFKNDVRTLEVWVYFGGTMSIGNDYRTVSSLNYDVEGLMKKLDGVYS